MATLYYVIYPSAQGTPSAAQIKAGQNASGSAATAAGSETARTTTGVETFASAATGLTAGTSYKVAFVWSDGSNDSAVSESSAWSTASSLSPDTGAVVYLGFAPTLSQPHTVSPSAGSAVTAGFAPEVQQTAGVFVGAGSVTWLGLTPTISQPRTIRPGVGAFDLLGYAPSVSQAALIAPLDGAIVVQGYAPALSQPRTIYPGAGALSIAGNAPGIFQTSHTLTLTADDIAAIWDHEIEAGLTARQMMRIMFAALAGKREGIGSATETYYGQDGVTPRITLTPDQYGNGTPTVDGA